jgi:hypothetical protein
MKHCLIAVVGSASIVAGADAGFAGFVAYSRNVGSNTVIDVFAAVQNQNDRFLNVYDTNSNGTFVQKAGLASKTWKPDAANFTSTRSVSDDSFMTAGTYSGGSYGGEYYASGNTNGDPNFTGTSWNATPASAAAVTIPPSSQYPAGSNGNSGAGWYTGDPTSIDNAAELMSTWASSVGATRTNSVKLAGSSSASANSNAAVYGIWCAHLVVAGVNKQIGVDFTFVAWASIKDGPTGGTSQAQYSIPAPGAIALLGAAALANSRRRR